MKKVNKNMREQIRGAILKEYRLGSNPLDASQRIQKMFGLNFETRSSTIRMWFEQFYLGDESLEHNPFREDLIPKRRETRIRKCVSSKNSKTSNSLPNLNDTQTKLLFQLKDQVDLLYRKINAQHCCLKLVDKFLKRLNTNDQQKSLETFCTNYRFLRKKCRKLPALNFYQILYDSLYCADDDKTTTSKNIINRRRKIVGRSKSLKNNKQNLKKNKKTTKNNSKLTNTQETVSTKRKRGRPKSSILLDKKPAIEINWPKLSTLNEEDQLPATCDECGKVFKNRLRLEIHVKQIHERTERGTCPFEGCQASYTRKACLYRHIRIVHTKDAREYRCTWADCSYVTYTSHMLQKHLNVHTGERPYKCVWPGCDKAFKSHSTLAFHKSIHKNERQYKCQWPGCGYACNVSSNLNKHTAIHERKQMQLSAVSRQDNLTSTATTNNTTTNLT